ncbi:hypothetical protein NWF32_16690 [Pseudomonas qingdaonensis]|nr:hypothetical protein [Pseudomonas qingdaonensis]
MARPAASSARIERFAQLARRFGEVPQVPFAVSVPLGKAAPDDIWRRLGNRVRARGPGAPAGYGDPLGKSSCARRWWTMCANPARYAARPAR